MVEFLSEEGEWRGMERGENANTFTLLLTFYLGNEWFKKEIIVNASTFSYLFEYQTMMYKFLNEMLKKIDSQIGKSKLKGRGFKIKLV